jgi:hypothetical protein
MNEVALGRRPRVGGKTVAYAGRARSRRAVVMVELATGGSALLCGGLLAWRPDGSLLGLPTRILLGGPFADWRLPGLLLAGLVGVGYLTAGAWQLWGYPHSRDLSMLAGTGLVAFEAVEWAWLGFHPLQVVFMAVGAGVVGLAAAAANAPARIPSSSAAGPRSWSS